MLDYEGGNSIKNEKAVIADINKNFGKIKFLYLWSTKYAALSLKIAQLVKFYEALSEIDFLFVVDAEGNNILCIYWKPVWHLLITFHGGAHLLDHARSKIGLLWCSNTDAGVLLMKLFLFVGEDIFFWFLACFDLDLNWQLAGLGYFLHILGFLVLMGHDVALNVSYIVEVVLHLWFPESRSHLFHAIIEFDALNPSHVVMVLLLLLSHLGLSINSPAPSRKRRPDFIEF